MGKFDDEYVENDIERVSGSRYRLKKRSRRNKSMILLSLTGCILGGASLTYSLFNENEQAAEKSISSNADQQIKNHSSENKNSEFSAENHHEDQAEATTDRDGDNQLQTKQKEQEHEIKGGDSLYKISIQYYHSSKYQQFLADYNHIQNSNNLTLGQTIKIPFPPPSEWQEKNDDSEAVAVNHAVPKVKWHEVEKGDTLYSISIMYYHSPNYQQLLAEYNGFKEPGALHIGDMIQIPSVDEAN